MISAFSFPLAILSGPGSLQELAPRLAKLGVKRPLVVTDAPFIKTGSYTYFQKTTGGQWPVFSGVHPNPVESDVEEATAAYLHEKCDSVIALGGGSALDVGKIIRLRLKRPDQKLTAFDFNADWSGLVPCVTIPTTAGTGSEVGRSSVIILNGKKVCIFHPSLMASLAILDPELTRGLPPKLTAATGADALTHCIESYTSPVFHPFCDGIALEGIHMTVTALPRAVRDGNDLEARSHMQIAASMGAIAFQKDLGATHSLAHPLSSICGLHHGLANALCLPFVMEFNAKRKPGLYQRVGIALGLADPSDAATIQKVRSLFAEIGIHPGLRAHGVNESHLDAMTEQAIADACHQTNPIPVTKQDMRHLYEVSL
jgi:alcohol dehydrogenase class IV